MSTLSDDDDATLVKEVEDALGLSSNSDRTDQSPPIVNDTEASDEQESSNEDESNSEGQDVSEEEEQPKTVSEISKEDQDLISSYESMSEKEREVRIKNMLTSGRKDQAEKGKLFAEIFHIETDNESEKEENEETENEDSKLNIDESVIDQILEQKLKSIGIDPELMKKIKKESDGIERQKAISKVIQENNLTIDPLKVATSKDFIIAYNDPDIKSLPIEKRTEFALLKSYRSAPVDNEKIDRARAMASKPQASGSVKATTPKIDFKNPDFIEGLSGKPLTDLL